MEDCLSAIGAGVGDQPVASLRNPLLFRESARHRKEVPHQRLIGLFQRAHGFDVLVWHDQDMCGSDRMDIPEGSYPVIPVDKFCLGFLRDNLAENTGFRHFESHSCEVG